MFDNLKIYHSIVEWVIFVFDSVKITYLRLNSFMTYLTNLNVKIICLQYNLFMTFLIHKNSLILYF